jgi:2-methylcitrate dehydratase PrpD
MTTSSITTSSTTNETYARRVARFVAETAYEALPPRAVEQAKNGLLDILGCALGGARVRASRAARAVVQAEAGPPPATVLTTGR